MKISTTSSTSTADATTDRATARNVVVLSSAAMFVGGLSLSSVNIALPAISNDIDASAAQSSWILLANLLASNALMVAFGKLADLTSRRRTFIGGIVAFTIGVILSALAPNGLIMIIGRAITGLGSAMMFATTSALIAAYVPRRRIGQAMGIYFACNSAAQLLGPVLGGILADTVGWEWIFWSNIPFCLLMFVGALKVLRRDDQHNIGSYDVSGGLLCVAMMTSFVAMLTTVGSEGVASGLALVCLGITAAILPLFIWRERRARHPMVDLTVFRNRLFTGTTATTFLSHIARFGILIVIALVYQSAHGLSATATGLLVLPIAIGSLVASPIAGWLEVRRGSAWVSQSGAVLVLIAVAGCSVMIWRPDWVVVVGISGAVLGCGGAMVLTANSSSVTKTVPPEKMGEVGSLRVMIQGTGIIAGNALALASLTLLLPAEGKSAVYAGSSAQLPDAYRDGLLDGIPITFGLFALAAIGSIVMSRIAYRTYVDE